MAKYNAVLIFGPPGIGKGTQAKMLTDDGLYFHFSSGDMFRNLDPNSDLGKEVRSYADKGALVPDDVTVRLFDATLQKYVEKGAFSPKDQYLLCDGVPRTVPQVPMMDERLDVKKIVYIDAPDNVLVARLKGRAVIEGRKDDADEAVVRNRLVEYKSKTLPVIEQYDNSLVAKVDGTGNVDQVHELVLKALKGL